MVSVTVDPRVSTPSFEQVRAQIEAAITSGELKPEERLPTVRHLAGDLGLAVNTVARSYRELEAAGWVETRGRHGTFIASRPSPTRHQAEQMTRDFAARMQALGLTSQEILATLRRQLGTGLEEPAPTAPAEGVVGTGRVDR
jgi:DNA-binding transcriptional regulator YhcF (GntR family)